MKGGVSTAQEHNSKNASPSQVHLVSQSILFVLKETWHTSRDLTRRTETSWRKLLLQPATQQRETAASQQPCAALGQGVQHQKQMAQHSTTAPECTKPSGNTGSAQHNVIKVFHLSFLKCPVKYKCLFTNNNTEFGVFCLCQQRDQNKWDLSPYNYLNNDRSSQYLSSKRFSLLLKNRKNTVQLSVCFYPEPPDLQVFANSATIYVTWTLFYIFHNTGRTAFCWSVYFKLTVAFCKSNNILLSPTWKELHAKSHKITSLFSNKSSLQCNVYTLKMPNMSQTANVLWTLLRSMMASKRVSMFLYCPFDCTHLSPSIVIEIWGWRRDFFFNLCLWKA